MSAYSKFKTDTKLETKGIVLDYDEFRVTIARAGGNNKRYERILEAKSRPYLRAIATDTMDNEVAQGILRETYAEAVILGWEVKGEDGNYQSGVADPKTGKLLPFSAGNVLRVLSDKALGDLWADIRAQASKASLFRASIDEARAGN